MKWAITILLFLFMPLLVNAQEIDENAANNYALYTFTSGCKGHYYQDFELGLLRKDQIPRLKKHTEDSCLCMGRAMFTRYSDSAVLKFTQSYFGSGMYDPNDVEGATYASGGERKLVLDFLNDARLRESCNYFGVFR